MALIPTRLTCNNLYNPLAVADPRPRLSWVLAGDSQRQAAYRITVGSAPSNSDLWDTGRVESGQTRDVQYQGRPLAPRQAAYWSVTVWDENGRASASDTFEWTAAPGKWDAEYIGFDAPLDAARFPDFMGTNWIWHADGPIDPVPVCTARFRKTFSAEPGMTEAQLLITADDSYTAFLNGVEVGKSDGNRDSWRRPGLHDITRTVKAGSNSIEVVVHSIGVSISGLICKIEMEHGARRTQVVSDASWEARWEEGTDWKPVRSLGGHGAPPWGGLALPRLFLPPPRVLSRRFQVARRVMRATLYATALGLFESRLNGRLVSEDWFAPGWTDYRKRLHYRAYDVTDLVQVGNNELYTTLADGWFSGYVGFGRRHHYGEHTRFSAMLWLDYEDGGSECVRTDETWRGATGTTTQSDFLMGENFDSRIEDLDWHPVVEGKEIDPVIEPYPMQPTVAWTTYASKSVRQDKNGEWVFDLGANFAGIPKVQGTGKTLILRTAEVLNPDETIYTTNLRSARATDVVTIKEGETWRPMGTFHGFRYVSAKGFEGQPSLEAVSGLALSNVARSASGFKCSDPRLNQLWENIDRTFRANFIEIPTDCPQRDERLGWTGDIQVFCRTAAILADVQAFLDKWLVDMADAQRADGQYPMFAPVLYGMDDGGPAWADAGTIVPWMMWEVYGDKAVLERQYESMKKFVGFCVGRLTPEFLPPKEFHCFGDWLNVGVETPTPVLFMLFLARSAWILGQTAEVLGKSEDARKNAELFKTLCLRFRAAYVDSDGWVQGKSQTGQVLALAFNVVAQDQRAAVFARLVEDIEKRGHLTTGFIGTKDLMLVLRDGRRADLAYKLLLSDQYPGWLFSIKHGATSIWERWDGWTPEKGFQDAGMNSFAHYAFGAVGQFMMETIGGIRPAAPGYEKVVVRVERGPLEWAECWYDSPRGRISTSWRGDTLEATIPPNVEAQVWSNGDWVHVGAGKHTIGI